MSLDVDHVSLELLFAPYVSPSLSRFWAILGQEDRNPWFDDGAVVIPWDSLGERAATWEEFVAEHPDFQFLAAAKSNYEEYRDVYLAGTGNSPPFPYVGDSTLVPEIKDSYLAFVSRHPGTTTGRLVADYLAVLEANRFLNTPEVQVFLTSHGIRRY